MAEDTVIEGGNDGPLSLDEKAQELPSSGDTSPARSIDSPNPDEKLFPETDLARGIVGWEGQDDPANPQNFSPTRKWCLLALISAITLISPLASSMFSPAVGYMGADFGVSNETLLSFSVTIFLLGYAVRVLLLDTLLLSNQNIYHSSAPFSLPL